MASMYDIGARYAALLDAMENAEGNDEAYELLDALAGMDDELEVKAEQYIRIIKAKEAEAEGFKKEAERLTAKRQAAENVAKRLKQAMLDAMKMTDTPTIKTSVGKWALSPNPMSCNVTDPDKVPERFHVSQPDKIDKAAMIREHKATGEVFDGAEFTQELGIRFR